MVEKSIQSSFKRTPASSHQSSQKWIILLLILISTALVIDLVQMIRRYSVNIIFWDQFDYMAPLMDHTGIWGLFSYQHGPHRQGLGEWIEWVVIRLTHWNTRADSYMILILLVLSLALAIFLKYRLTGKLDFLDVLLPFIFLNPAQWEQLVLTYNPSHSALPLFLIMVYAIAWFISSEKWRLLVILLLNFLLVFTGFGIFMGILTGSIFTLELIAAYSSHQKNKIRINSFGLAGVILIYLLFFSGYMFAPAADCFGISWSMVSRYPAFISVMFAKFIGVAYSTQPVMAFTAGAILFISVLVTFLWNGVIYIRDPFGKTKKNKEIAILSGFTLLFAFSAAVGRVCFGVLAGQSSRYMTLLVPGFLAMVLNISLWSRGGKKTATSLLLAVCALSSVFSFSIEDQASALNYTRGRIRWRECYLATGDYNGCDRSTDFKIYPQGSERIQAELDYLQENHLNMFRGTPPEPAR